MQQKRSHINQRDRWATGADLGWSSATQIADGVDKINRLISAVVFTMASIKIAKNSLQRNYTRFIKELANPEDVADYLYSDVDPPLLTEGMLDEVKVQKTPTQKTKKLLDKLSKRGERVPQKLYEALMETGNEELAQCMIEYISMQNDEKQKTAPSEWPPKEQELDEMLEKKIHQLKPNDPIAYRVDGKRRGICLIINIVEYQNKQKPELKERKGSDEDAKNLLNVFKELHFDVQQRGNLTSEEILNEAENLAKTVLETDSCVVLAIFSHGGKDGIYGSDNVPVKLENIKEKFYPVECPALNEKPKIFFIQACRGLTKETAGALSTAKEGKQAEKHTTDSEADHNTLYSRIDQITDNIGELTVSDVNTESEPQIQGTLTVSRDSDFLIAYSTPEGAQSWRHEKLGSWFILAVVWVFRYHAHELSLTDMLQRVNRYVSQGKTSRNDVTVSNFTTSLRHPLFFFPGIYNFNGYPREHPGTLE
ncbi:hypothetical protein FSP39_010653 [Pinctada imbricata]|uniref:Uncharacterized protein n=1 Tax=Pinctada imbricata TaxID=66713 RepID=A0AA88XLY0_PINIB|nr:hypothetical protein FSP39_010653 [Pinctada imbricata]